MCNLCPEGTPIDEIGVWAHMFLASGLIMIRHEDWHSYVQRFEFIHCNGDFLREYQPLKKMPYRHFGSGYPEPFRKLIHITRSERWFTDREHQNPFSPGGMRWIEVDIAIERRLLADELFHINLGNDVVRPRSVFVFDIHSLAGYMTWWTELSDYR